MLMYVAIAVLLIAVLILFLPSRKNKSAEGSQQNEDTVKNKKAKKVDKSLKEKRVKESPRKQKKTKVNPRFAKKQGNVDDIPDLDDAMLNLGAEVQEMQQLQEDASAPAESKQSTYGEPAESMHNAPEVEQNAEMAKESEADSKPKKPRFKQKKEEEIKEVKSAPVIQMAAPEDEPVMHSNRVRKKLVTEDPNKNKQEVVTGISFTGANDGLEATGVDDLFADPELSEENYKKMLFEATEDVNLTDNGISGIQAVPEEIEQVSADLEPIAAPTKEQVRESTESETKNVLQESLDETTTAVDNVGIEPSTVTEEEQPAESSISTEPAETTEEVKTVDETDTNEESIAPIEPAEPAEPDGSTDDFVPGSVSLLKSTGLKFRKRESTVKASEALPTDFVPHSNDSQVHGFTVTGALFTHPIIGQNMVLSACNAIDGFPSELRDVICHCILAHHGELEWGAAVKPVIVEAYIVHCCDTLDAHAQVFREALTGGNSTLDDIGFTSKNFVLGTKVTELTRLYSVDE